MKTWMVKESFVSTEKYLFLKPHKNSEEAARLLKKACEERYPNLVAQGVLTFEVVEVEE